VAQSVIDLLKPVKVEIEHREVVSVRRAEANRRLELGGKHRTVR
jgi:hypothetical protein